MPELTTERLRELRRIAEAATPGEWRVMKPQEEPGVPVGWYVTIPRPTRKRPNRSLHAWIDREEDARHIAAFAPPTVLALLDEIERLRQERDTLDSGLDGLEQAIQYRDWPAVVAFLRAARKMIDAKNGGGQYE